MKARVLSLILIFLGAIASVKAQETGNVSLSINLHQIQIIKINPSQSEVTIDYKNAEDYLQGVVSVQQGHLTVFSTSGYEVAVSSDAPLKVNNGNSAGSAQAGLMVGALLPQSANGAIQVNNVFLQGFKQSIISSQRSDLGLNFDIEYQGLGNNGFLNLIDPNQAITNRKTQVVYTIEVK